MSGEVFLIDTNSLISPHLQYYPFDLAPGFWEQMQNHIKSGRIAILDLVKKEVLKGNDALKDWMESIAIGNYIDHRSPDILNQYRQVLQTLQFSPCYKPIALKTWSDPDSVADPWLIATASVSDYTIITFEKRNGALSPNNPCKSAKIPDIADHFNVKVDDLYYMMRALQFKLC